MFNFSTIIPEYKELDGYREENGVTLSASQKISDSNYFVNDLAGVSLQNIKAALYLKEADLSQEETVSEYLDKIFEPELLNMIQNFIKAKENILKTKKLVRNYDLIENWQTEKLDQTTNFHGFMFNFKNSKNLYGVINSISLQLDTADTVKIYLYDLQTKTALKTFDYTVTEDLTQIMETVTDWIIKYQDANSARRTYLLGYYDYDGENPLPNHQLSEGTKSYRLDYEYNKDLLFFNLMPISISKDNWNYNAGTGVYDLPDEDGITGNCYSFGLNARMSFDADYTDVLIKYKDKFAQALQYQLAKRIIDDCRYSNEFNTVTESNRIKFEALSNDIDNKLKGYTLESPTGQRLVRDGILTEIVNELEGLDNVIFPKRRKMVI
jgi:hypothetical protein